MASFAAHAQDATLSLGAASSDRYRGLGPTYEGPVARASASIETPALGAYASGATAWQLQDGHWGRSQAMAGISRAIGGTAWSWDAGAARTWFGQDHDYAYTEWMAGLLHRDGAVRAWWSKHYYGGPVGSLYLEASGSLELSSRWRALAHVGQLRYLRAAPGGYRWDPRTDGLVGLAWSGGAFDARLTLDGLLAGHEPHGLTGGGASSGLVLSAAWTY